MNLPHLLIAVAVAFGGCAREAGNTSKAPARDAFRLVRIDQGIFEGPGGPFRYSSGIFKFTNTTKGPIGILVDTSSDEKEPSLRFARIEKLTARGWINVSGSECGNMLKFGVLEPGRTYSLRAPLSNFRGQTGLGRLGLSVGDSGFIYSEPFGVTQIH